MPGLGCRVTVGRRKKQMTRSHVLIAPHSTLSATFATANDTTTGDRPRTAL